MSIDSGVGGGGLNASSRASSRASARSEYSTASSNHSKHTSMPALIEEPQKKKTRDKSQEKNKSPRHVGGEQHKCPFIEFGCEFKVSQRVR